MGLRGPDEAFLRPSTGALQARSLTAPATLQRAFVRSPSHDGYRGRLQGPGPTQMGSAPRGDSPRRSPQPSPVPRQAWDEGRRARAANSRWRWRQRKRARARWSRWPPPRKPWSRRQVEAADNAWSPNPPSPSTLRPPMASDARLCQGRIMAHPVQSRSERGHIQVRFTLGRQMVIEGSTNDWLMDGAPRSETDVAP
jgi:hypothetical protein